MKPMFWVGVVVLVLGIASLLIAIPRKETQGVKAGNMSIGVELEHKERVSPIISAVLIVVGGGLIITRVSRR